MRVVSCLVTLTAVSVLMVTPADAAGAGSLWTDLTLYIRDQQLAFHRELASSVRAIQDGGIMAAWGLVVVSFLYGVFHAAGPGHGKAIISTYLVTHESRLKQGIGLAMLSALVQGVSALLLVGLLVGIVGWSARDVQSAVTPLEAVSFGLVALLGAVLAWRSLKGLVKTRLQFAHAHSHAHGHSHHDHSDGACSSCGHNHAPDPAQLDGKEGWRDRAAIIFSVGIRPCSGSVLVLVFAELIGLRWAGVASVFAVSIGTGLTVSLLATLSVYARKIALLLGRGAETQALQTGTLVVGFGGGLVIVALGLSLLHTTLTTGTPLF